MAHYYVVPWRRSATPPELEDYEPAFDGVVTGVIDLRPSGYGLDGYCFVSSEDSVGNPAGGRYLGDNLDSALPGNVRNQASNVLGFTVRNGSIRNLLAQTLIEEARTDGTRWRPLQPRQQGVNQWEIWLGGPEPAYAVPRVRGGATAADTFDRGNSATLGTSSDGTWSWNETRGGSWEIVGNRAKVVGGSQASYARCELPMGTENNRAGFTLATYSGGTNTQVGACMRMQSTSDNCYLVMRDMTSSGTRLKIRTSTNGSRSDISALFNIPYSTNEVIEGRCDGSTISLIRNGVVEASATNTLYATGGRTGIYGFWNTGTCLIEVDDFFASEWPIEVAGGFPWQGLAPGRPWKGLGSDLFLGI